LHLGQDQALLGALSFKRLEQFVHDLPGRRASRRSERRPEEPFGWRMTIGGLARPILRGVEKLAFKFTLTTAAHN